MYLKDTRVWKNLLFAAGILIVLLMVTDHLCFAQMKPTEFDALVDADKRTVLISTLEEREEAVRNLKASSLTKLYNVEYREGKTGALVNEHGRFVCELRRNDGNFWASVECYIPGDELGHPYAKSVTTMDSRAGIARSLAEHKHMQGTYGAISTECDSVINSGCFHYWFDAAFDEPQEFVISFLLQHRNAIKFEGLSEDQQHIKISLLFEESKGTPYQDARTVWIDPGKGFMPVRIHRRWEYASEDRPFYSDTKTEILKLEEVDGVWFPTHFIETAIGRMSVEEGYATVYETTVEDIKLGTVSAEDLAVRFPNGTAVQDRIKGVRFVADEETQWSPTPGPPASPAKSRKWLIVLNATILALVLVWMARRKKLGHGVTG